jgi:hypothetical protein
MGNIKNKNRVGEKHITNEGYEIEIIEYFGAKNCTIKFNYNNYIKYKVAYSDLEKKWVKNPFHPSVHNVGYIGIKEKSNISSSPSYNKWKSMLERCYNEKALEKHPTYREVTVCEEWHNFQNFTKWYDNNLKPWMDKSWHLDKDLLVKGNKIYSPDTCVFIPQEINKLFLNSINYRGAHPKGVWKNGEKYCAEVIGSKIKERLGTFDTPEIAFGAYKKAKEKIIKIIADNWKNKITPQTYRALYNYQVEITD